MTEIAWDPSGRYCTSHATSWRPGVSLDDFIDGETRRDENETNADFLSSFLLQTDSGYTIWDFKGQELKRDNIDAFKQFLWRPRPASLLTKEDQKRVRKTLREFSRTFDEEDAAAESQGSAEVLQLRRRLIDEWNAWQASARSALEEERKRLGVWPTVVRSGKKEEEEVVEEWIEIVLEEKEEVIA